MKIPSNFEQAVMEAIIALKAEAYGVPIRKRISDKFNKNISVGQLYSTLDRLEKEGFLESYEGGITNERGGRRKRYFKVCAKGVNALCSYKSFMDNNLNELELTINSLIKFKT